MRYRTVLHSVQTGHRVAVDQFQVIDAGESKWHSRRIREGLWIAALPNYNKKEEAVSCAPVWELLDRKPRLQKNTKKAAGE